MARKTEAMILADERQRVHSILSSPEGVRNPHIARELVLQGADLSQAMGLLRLAPPENPYLAAMEIHGHVPVPGVTGDGVLGGQDPRATRLAEIKEAAAAVNARHGYTRG